MQTRIAVFDTKPDDQEFLAAANREFDFDLKFLRPRLTADTVRLAEGYPVICAFVNDRLDAPIVAALAAGGTRLVALRCAGYNQVDLTACHARLPTFPTVLITSHQAFFTREALTEIARTTLENIRRFAAGEPLANEICCRCAESACPQPEACAIAPPAPDSARAALARGEQP